MYTSSHGLSAVAGPMNALLCKSSHRIPSRSLPTPKLGLPAPTVLSPLMPSSPPSPKTRISPSTRGQLKGKFVLTEAIPESPERFDPQAHRYTDAELADLGNAPVPGARTDQEERIAQFRARRDFQLKVQPFLVDEGVAVWIEPSRGDDGTVFVQQGGGRDKDKILPPRAASLSPAKTMAASCASSRKKFPSRCMRTSRTSSMTTI